MLMDIHLKHYMLLVKSTQNKNVISGFNLSRTCYHTNQCERIHSDLRLSQLFASNITRI